jgi:large subunit ribosomal protein L20
MHGMKINQIAINRKMLADLAVRDPQAFTAVVAQAKVA